VQHDYANCWVYGSIAPSTGERFFLLLPTLDADQMQIFLDEFAKAHPSTFTVLLLDNSGAHTAKRLKIPPNVALVFQPAATPELNPAERVWQDLKTQLAWLTFKDLDALEQEIVERLCAYAAATLSALTGYPYLVEAAYALQF
jgi:transposase